MSGGKAGLQELLELAAALAGEHPAVLVTRQVEQVGDAVVGGVVQVRRAGQCRRLIGQDRGEPEQVVAVVADLQRGVGDRALAVLLDANEGVAVLEPLGGAPLLELDDEVRRAAGRGWRPARTTSARLLVSGSWYSNSISTSPRPAEMRSARRAGMLRSHERRSPREGRCPVPDHHLLGKEVGEVVLDGGEAERRLAEQCHRSGPQAARSHSCGWGHVLTRKPVGPQLRARL